MTLSTKTPKKHDVSDLKCKNDGAFFAEQFKKLNAPQKSKRKKKGPC